MRSVVSIVVPCRNEANNIDNLITSIFNSNYDKDLLEVIIVDGMSDDGTRELVSNYKKEQVKLLDNVNKLTPYAFNLGIKASKGDFIVILGARHVISENYFTEIVSVLNNDKNIACIGGVVRNIYSNEISKTISKAMASPFGIGFSNFRAITQDTFVDTVGSPAFRKEIFEEIGYFDERLTRNQDDDFSFRLIRAGYKILLKANIHIDYVVRGSFSKLYKQYKQYGYWKVFVNKKHKTVTTLRQLFPALFLLSLIILPILSLILPIFGYLLGIEILMYFLLSFIFSFKDNKFNIVNLIKQMYTCMVLHVSYGLGYLEGILDFIIFNKQPNSKNEELSR